MCVYEPPFMCEVITLCELQILAVGLNGRLRLKHACNPKKGLAVFFALRPSHTPHLSLSPSHSSLSLLASLGHRRNRCCLLFPDRAPPSCISLSLALTLVLELPPARISLYHAWNWLHGFLPRALTTTNRRKATSLPPLMPPLETAGKVVDFFEFKSGFLIVCLEPG